MATNNLHLPRLEPSVGWSTDREIGRYITRVDIVDHHGRHWGSVAVGREHTMDREEQIARLWAAAGEMHEALSHLLKAIRDLVAESDGVAGLHLNGDIATWDELLHSPWLGDAMDKAEAVLAKARG